MNSQNEVKMQMETNCKHRAPSDDDFTARMRFHQSWYRRHVLGLPPGPNPHAGGALYGNLLCASDGEAGWNFLTETIATFVRTRLANDAKHIDASRLRNNLLSSQPMCFNLFAPLALDLERATRFVKALPGLAHVARVVDVRLEYAPMPKKDFLDDGTSFDAWIEYERADGALGFIGIETKLTEPFSQDNYTFDERYSKWTAKGDWWWKPGAENVFSTKSFNQLWRNHLLAFAQMHHSSSNCAECFSAVIRHSQDKGCSESMKAYRQRLLPVGNETLLEWTLDSLINRWLPLATTREEHFWLQSFRLRYLDLEASEAAWKQHQEPETINP